MSRRWLLFLVCLGCALFFVSQVSQITSARFEVSVDETTTRIFFRELAPEVALIVKNGSNTSMRAVVRIELLEPDNTIHGTTERKVELKPGTQKVPFTLPAKTRELTPDEDDEILWYRLHYRITPEPAESNSTGCYRFQNIAAGTYRMEIEATGFGPSQVPNIVLRASDNNRLDQTLSIAAAGDSEKPVLETVIVGGMVAIRTTDPLVLAAESDDIEAVKEALRKIDPNTRDTRTQWSALEHAVRNGNREMVQLLLWAKADVTARDRTGQTVLMMLDENATSELVWDLINAGAKVNARDSDGDTALSELALVNNTEALKTLLDAGARVNEVNNDGESALMKAAAEGQVNNLRVLIQAGADVNQRSKTGKTALMYTRENDHRAAVRLLISMGAVEFEEKEPK